MAFDKWRRNFQLRDVNMKYLPLTELLFKNIDHTNRSDENIEINFET